MSKTRINYKSDFSLDVTFAINSAAVPLPTNDFLVRFFVDGAPGTTYVCGHKNGEYINSEKKDDDTLTCYIDNHKFGCGRLCCEFVDLEDNDKFTDGVQKTVTPSRLDIVLVEGAGDSSTNVSASVLVDIEAVISNLRDALDDIEEMQDDIEDLQEDVEGLETAMEGKLDYYDASWIYRASQRTEANFNALKDTSLARKVIVVNDNICVSDGETFENKVILSHFREGGYNHIVVSLVEGAVGVSSYFIVYAESAAVDTLGERVTSAEGGITSLGGRIDVLETWKTNVGNAASIVHYVDCDWLDNGSGTLQNYTTLHDGILADHKVLLKNSQTAIYYTADDVNNVLTVVFFNGTRIDTYTITKGSSGCTVSKTEKNVTTITPYIS